MWLGATSGSPKSCSCCIFSWDEPWPRRSSLVPAVVPRSATRQLNLFDVDHHDSRVEASEFIDVGDEAVAWAGSMGTGEASLMEPG